jgi:hypothetical protein
MPTEPMITIKDADGTMRQVPLSQLTNQAAQTASSLNASPQPAVSIVDTAPKDDIAELAELAAKQVASESSSDDAHEEDPLTALLDTTIIEDEDDTDPWATIVPMDTRAQDDAAIDQEIVTENIHTDLQIRAQDRDSRVTPTSPQQVESSVTDADRNTKLTQGETSMQSLPTQMVGKRDTTEIRTESADVADVRTDELMVLPTPGPLTTAVPNREIFSAGTEWSEDDHASLLDEPLTDIDATIPHSTRRPGSVAALTATTPTPSTVVPSNKMSTSSAPTTKKPNTQQFNEAFAAIAPRTDSPYTPGLKKVPMQDIVAAPPTRSVLQPTGPVAELGSMTLDDFRRLGGRGVVGSAELRAKFELLLKESIVLYMQGVAAWHQSPLYRAYLDVINTSVIKHLRVEDVFQMTGSNPDFITDDEWHALVRIHADIRL